MATIEEFLTTQGIAFTKYTHPAVFTCEESERLCPPMEGGQTKNLFLRDRRAKRHMLVTVGHHKNVDLKALKEIIDADKLSFASPERLKEFLGVEPGSATLLGVITDTEKKVEVFIDADLWKNDILLCHPMVNTATLGIKREDIEKFLRMTGHAPKIIDVPARAES